MISVWQFFLHETGWVAKIVLGILLFFSLASWAIILAKYLTLKRVKRQNTLFRRAFHKAGKFSEATEIATRHPASSAASIFKRSYDEVSSQAQQGGVRWDLVEREMGREQRAYHARLRSGLAFLATTAGATPFIGLFGTVWGIMNAFRQIGLSGSSSLATVAPGISEALINTAAGLFAAIPALMAYNLFVNGLRRIAEDDLDFSDMLLTLLMKRVPARTTPSQTPGGSVS
ncbi:MAG TPA: MotA/TolQ/ExbB proton channel family protein [Thermoanaerobaculia bacterium]|nr:MotA/TolQ/ExbB proton channel family protein [Thermoanaerobaculia bacterium]HUM29929.1 MotA/TolQ/ExbB proton channel family protein [Thermoanaerobaculia bacterium]HXK68204.1 MotA/TolQ/ExbB proton channel family protein [Thermoanaerobaculia bacterium]